MNRGGGFQSFLVQQMTMGGNPSSWWASNMNSNSVRAAAALVDQEEAANSLLPSSSPSPSSVFPHHQFQSLQPSSHLLPTNQDLPESWSQLLLQGGLGGGEEYSCRYGSNNPFQAKDHEMEMYQAGSEHMGSSTVKQEISSENAYAYSKPQWSQMLQASSPRSCVTSTASFNSNMLDFSNNKPPELGQGHHQQPENSSECNSTTSGSAFKKARVQGSSPLQSTFKVRKEKLGDRITALHQIVSPFGKGQGERNCIFPEDPGQLLQDNTTKKRVSPEQGFDNETKNKDLRTRGLCLVPVSCTLHVGGGSAADFWAPNALGGGF
ncbi:Transcription factor bHLH68 [Ananas comosus]|uniref:Transcription factor bHLH68 n=1 Tax=Ananas comosus TaxID=4615 RepID=A0A199V9D1_ANACO|nr:Transcription factor bHLH68 [Ananas comosus]